MKIRNFILGAVGLVIILVIAGYFYTSHFADTVSQSEAHVAAGTATPTGTPIPSTGLTTYNIVPSS